MEPPFIDAPDGRARRIAPLERQSHMMGDGMTVSVVIPAYDTGPRIHEVLESVFAQTRPADQVVVVDDGSTDGTADLVQSLAGDGVMLIRQDNAGGGQARNRGIGASTGSHIALLDHDDCWGPRTLERQLGASPSAPENAQVIRRNGLVSR